MSEQAGPRLDSSESVVVEPNVFTLRVPLHGAIELEIEDDEQDDTPEGRVEQFLQANGDIFQSVEEAWAIVGQSQQVYRGFVQEFHTSSDVASQPREIHRKIMRGGQHFINYKAVFGACKLNAQIQYPRTLGNLRNTNPLEQANQAFVERLTAYMASEEQDLQQRTDRTDLPRDFLWYVKQFEARKVVLTTANMYALFRQDAALRKLDGFLSDDAVVDPFVARLLELARDNQDYREYPGLLELVANDVAQENQDSVLYKAVRRSAPDKTAYARELLESYETGQQGVPKELSAAMGVLDMAVGILVGRFQLSRQDSLELFAEQSDSWPAALADRLQSYTTGRTQERWNSLRATLSDHTIDGRLRGVRYTLDVDGISAARTPRRFSPRYFRGVARGDIAAKTRLIYDIVGQGDNKTLVVYGAFLKQDIENMTRMPRIR